MTAATVETTDQDERAVEEVHCIECGVPMSSIPGWYAGVRVKFSCDACRQRRPTLTAPVPVALDADLKDGGLAAVSDVLADPDGEEEGDGEVEVDADLATVVDDTEVEEAEAADAA